MKKQIYQIVGDKEQTNASDICGNPIKITSNGGDIIDNLKKMGYTNAELKEINWRLEIESCTLYFEYRQDRLELTDCKLDKDNSYKINRYEVLEIVKRDDFMVSPDKVSDSFLTQDSNYTCQFKSFPLTKIYKVCLGSTQDSTSQHIGEKWTCMDRVYVYDEEMKLMNLNIKHIKDVIKELKNLGYTDAQLAIINWEYFLEHGNATLTYVFDELGTLNNNMGGLKFKNIRIDEGYTITQYVEEIEIKNINDVEMEDHKYFPSEKLKLVINNPDF